METKTESVEARSLRRILIFVKSTYFLFIGGRSVYVSFIVVFLAFIGLSSKEIGVVRGIQSLILFIASPFIGILSDRIDKHKVVFLLGIAGMAVFYFSVAFLPVNYSELKESSNLSFTVNGTNVLFDEYYSYDNYTDDSNETFVAFFGSLLLISLGEIFYSGVPPLLDSNTETLARMTPTCSFGQQRLWGSVGSIVLLTATGYMLNIMNKHFTLVHEFFSAFLVFIVCEFLCLIPAWFIPLFPHESRDTLLRAHLYEVLRHPRFAIMLIVAFVLGMTSSQDTFKYLLLDELGANHLNRSLCIVFNCLGELPLMWYSRIFLERLGNENAICFVLLIWIIRLSLYCVIQNPWLILPIEFLNGVTFGLWSTAITSFCREISVAKTAVSVLAVANAMNTGIGVAAGNLFGGLVYSAWGPRVLFGGVACVDTIVFGMYIIFLRCCAPLKIKTISANDGGKFSKNRAEYSVMVLYKETSV